MHSVCFRQQHLQQTSYLVEGSGPAAILRTASGLLYYRTSYLSEYSSTR